jgi:uncharacterized protein (TIGR02246 family)
MKTHIKFLSWYAVIAVIAVLFVARAEAQPSGDAEATIRAAANEFVEAFDRGDAKALAGHFASDGVYVNELSQRFEGRDAIEKEYGTLFENASGLKLNLEIDSIRLVNATTAVEEGRVALTPQSAGEIRVMSAYTALHTLSDGKWLMSHVRDTRVELPPDPGQLEDLSFLVGTWVAEGKGVRTEVKGRWIEENHFLARSHSVTESGQVTSSGLEIIGIDPSTQRITSWCFTGDGEHAVGLWAPHDNGWLVESIGTMIDGTETVATNHLSKQDDETLIWKSTNRWIGDATLPDIQPVTLKRQ